MSIKAISAVLILSGALTAPAFADNWRVNKLSRVDARLDRAEYTGRIKQGSRADRWEDRLDRFEDKIDRREDRRDRAVTHGPRDLIEDRLDRLENKVDRAENRYDRRR